MVRAKRLELIRRKTPDPKSGASAIPPRPHAPDDTQPAFTSSYPCCRLTTEIIILRIF